MRAITVRQPWAHAIIHLGKDVENRTRNIAGAYRGPVAIHAGLTEDRRAYRDSTLLAAHAADDDWRTPGRGTVIGVVNLWAVHEAAPACCPNLGASPFGSPWAEPNAWHLCVTDPRPLAEPVPARGRLGLWRPDPDLAAAIERRIPPSTQH